ncbi:hypothetical protein TNIN_400781 [Trichonephila inaurata madagascariensis]|uniref:Uncharacterized protein n=1 Tax=Trichonephila inaurata madagascariensis TaxID=2747483 RepID=A0A8X7CAA0_9ARAC|nr:hypothetical protein TNIN_400781 [Trichonephila inaurata madagascariensis]
MAQVASDKHGLKCQNEKGQRIDPRAFASSKLEESSIACHQHRKAVQLLRDCRFLGASLRSRITKYGNEECHVWYIATTNLSTLYYGLLGKLQILLDLGRIQQSVEIF